MKILPRGPEMLRIESLYPAIGAFVFLSDTSSMHAHSPLHRVSPTDGCFPSSALSLPARYSPSFAAFSIRFSFLYTSMFAMPQAHARAWPQYVRPETNFLSWK